MLLSGQILVEQIQLNRDRTKRVVHRVLESLANLDPEKAHTSEPFIKLNIKASDSVCYSGRALAEISGTKGRSFFDDFRPKRILNRPSNQQTSDPVCPRLVLNRLFSTGPASKQLGISSNLGPQFITSALQNTVESELHEKLTKSAGEMDGDIQNYLNSNSEIGESKVDDGVQIR
ncbi:hypothetical protein FRX31_022734 [Thalictrum thalictroides]|uniref:Uncharacterized protein n=1 Tax=Thalictrum thalictroides TaxID=46969 RepID=A0A7J6VRF9_THATH|nr:hypothetical protein FRX31_022734 [Thalictrum thalictroides]